MSCSEEQRPPAVRIALYSHMLCLQKVRETFAAGRKGGRSGGHCLADPSCDKHELVRGERSRTPASFIADLDALARSMCECKDAACAGELDSHLRTTVLLHEDDEALPADLAAAAAPAIRKVRACVTPRCASSDATCTDGTRDLLP